MIELRLHSLRKLILASFFFKNKNIKNQISVSREDYHKINSKLNHIIKIMTVSAYINDNLFNHFQSDVFRHQSNLSWHQILTRDLGIPYFCLGGPIMTLLMKSSYLTFPSRSIVMSVNARISSISLSSSLSPMAVRRCLISAALMNP